MPKRTRPFSTRNTRRKRYKATRTVAVPRQRLGMYANRKAVAVKRTYHQGIWTFSSASTPGFYPSYTFQAGQLPSWSEFSALFKQYRFNAIKVTFYPRWTDADIQTNTIGIPTLFIQSNRTALVPTGTYVQATLNTFLEANSRRLYMNKPRSHYMKVNELETSSGASQSQPKYGIWHNVTDSTTNFYGFNVFWYNQGFTTPPSTLTMDVLVTYYFQVKDLR